MRLLITIKAFINYNRTNITDKLDIFREDPDCLRTIQSVETMMSEIVAVTNIRVRFVPSTILDSLLTFDILVESVDDLLIYLCEVEKAAKSPTAAHQFAILSRNLCRPSQMIILIELLRGMGHGGKTSFIGCDYSELLNRIDNELGTDLRIKRNANIIMNIYRPLPDPFGVIDSIRLLMRAAQQGWVDPESGRMILETSYYVNSMVDPLYISQLKTDDCTKIGIMYDITSPSVFINRGSLLIAKLINPHMKLPPMTTPNQ